MKNKIILVVLLVIVTGIIFSDKGFAQSEQLRLTPDLTFKSKVEPDLIANYFDDAGLDSYILDIMNSYHIAGCASCLLKDGEVVWKGNFGYANVEENKMVTDSTLFTMASISKTFTATALMQLWENGLFDLDDDIKDYLPPDLQVHNPKYPDDIITFRMLLTHTSSMFDNRDITYDLLSQGDPQISLDTFLVNYLIPGGNYYSEINFYDERPGSEYHYSNVAFALIGYLVEKISSTPFDQYCKENIFNPLEMYNTAWFLSQLDTNNVAMPCYWDGNFYSQFGHIGYAEYPARLLKTSIRQLANFLSVFINNEETILESATIKLILTDQLDSPVIEENGNWYRGQGLCWYEQLISDHWLWGHTGGMRGVCNFMFFSLKENWGILALSNTGHKDYSWDGIDLIRISVANFAAVWGKIYAYETEINRSFLQKDIDSVLVQTKFVNRDDHDFMAHAVILNVDSTYTDSVRIYDDGQHGDAQAVDGIWGNYIGSPSVENDFILTVSTLDLITDDYFRSTELERFTTIGPVVYSDWSPYIIEDSIPNPGDFIGFKLHLKNEGKVSTAEDISARIYSNDPKITVHNLYSTFGDIGAGNTVESKDGYRYEISSDISSDTTIYLSINISSGEFNFWSDSMEVNVVTNISPEHQQLPLSYALKQNFPNPFNPTTNIPFELPKAEHVTLEIFSITGEKVKILLNRKMSAGKYEVEFDGGNLSSGVYLYRLSAGSNVETKKMILLK